MNDKIRPDHLERAAYVYVRQSSLQQVRHHREGQQRQYGLADRARQVGFARVVVIDDDLRVCMAKSNIRAHLLRESRFC